MTSRSGGSGGISVCPAMSEKVAQIPSTSVLLILTLYSVADAGADGQRRAIMVQMADNDFSVEQSSAVLVSTLVFRSSAERPQGDNWRSDVWFVRPFDDGHGEHGHTERGV